MFADARRVLRNARATQNLESRATRAEPALRWPDVTNDTVDQPAAATRVTSPVRSAIPKHSANKGRQARADGRCRIAGLGHDEGPAPGRLADAIGQQEAKARRSLWRSHPFRRSLHLFHDDDPCVFVEFPLRPFLSGEDRTHQSYTSAPGVYSVVFATLADRRVAWAGRSCSPSSR
jgi:hypothetical protein